METNRGCASLSENSSFPSGPTAETSADLPQDPARGADAAAKPAPPTTPGQAAPGPAPHAAHPANSPLSEVSDSWLTGRARELNAIGQHSDEVGQRTTIHEADTLLTEGRRRGEPRMIAQLLRHCASLRLIASGFADTADPLLEELLTHARRHGLVVFQADAHALRGRRALLAGHEDDALTEVAHGLAMLDDDLAPDRTLGRRSWERVLATALVDLGLVLTQLGIYDKADEVMARAHQRIRESGGPHEIAVHLINRCRMLLGWGMRLERVGADVEANQRYDTASAIAEAAEGPWCESLFPRSAGMPAADQMPVLGGAHALARPGAEHIPRLRSLLALDRTVQPRERVIVAIALSRCLVHANQQHEAIDLLARVRRELEHDTTEPTLRISLFREQTRLSTTDGSEIEAVLRSYTAELESELWTMRQTRISTLETRLENSRLSNKHDAITRQALQDPLTGLNNRRALDERLEEFHGDPAAQPLAVALVDLDRFKAVNDHSSHADGDDVLRTVAGTLRDTLRTDDFVARYGGDEFVVLLPGATLDAAETALARSVRAISKLPVELSRSVTLSVGVVAARPQESTSRTLARADEAMYQAKRAGGDQVCRAPEPTTPRQRGGPGTPGNDGRATWIPPDVLG